MRLEQTRPPLCGGTNEGKKEVEQTRPLLHMLHLLCKVCWLLQCLSLTQIIMHVCVHIQVVFKPRLTRWMTSVTSVTSVTGQQQDKVM